MATTSLTLLAAGTNSEWSLGSGDTRPSCVQLPDDEDATYIQTGVNQERDDYTKSGISAESITSAKIISRARVNAAVNANCTVRYVNYSIPDSAGTIFATSSESYANRDTGNVVPGIAGAWTPADFATGSSWEVGVKRESTGAGVVQMRVTTLDPQVTYTPASGGWYSWIGLLPPMYLVADFVGQALNSEPGFFSWLHLYQQQCGYKTRITPDTPDYDPLGLHRDEREWALNQLLVQPRYCFLQR